MYFYLMEVTDELIRNLAELSRLEFNKDEQAEIKSDLQKMISFIEKLNELDTTGVEPVIHMTENVNVVREDEVTGQVSSEEVFLNAPQHNNKFFLVPKVIKK